MAIGFLFLFSLIPYVNYNVYGQVQSTISGFAFSSVTVTCGSPSPPGGPSSYNDT